jgi:hypothetical protein
VRRLQNNDEVFKDHLTVIFLPRGVDHENVPTWNYIAVHVYGKKSIIEGEHRIRKAS